MTVSQNGKYRNLKIIDWSGFCASFPVQTVLSFQLGFSTQWIEYSNLRKILLLLINLCHLLRFLKCFTLLIVATTWLDSQNTGWSTFGTFQGYCHMAELLVKIAHVVFELKVVLNYSAVKGFHISILMSVHSKCIDSTQFLDF